MPAFPSLTGLETADLIRYLRTLRPRTGSGLSDAGRADWRRLVNGLILNQSATTFRYWATTGKSTCSARSARRIEPHFAVRLARYNGRRRKPLQPLAQITTSNISRSSPVDLQSAQHVTLQ